jgi:Tfp pilus assembly protein PilO
MTTTTTQTALMPIDPAVSPQQISRIVPIRANLLPTEVTSHRSARHTRIIMVGVAVFVIVLLAVWYLFALNAKSAADDAMTDVNSQVRTAQRNLASHQELTTTLAQQETISGQLKTLLANDLPWATTLDALRSTGAKVGLTVSNISANPGAVGATAAGQPALVTLTIGGAGPDKYAVAAYVDALTKVHGIANPYVTGVIEESQPEIPGLNITFTLNASITPEALCGRLTTPC